MSVSGLERERILKREREKKKRKIGRDMVSDRLIERTSE